MTISFRRLATVLASFALISATAVPPVAACEDSHSATTAMAMDVSGHAGHAANGDGHCPESDAPSPCNQDHGSDCVAMCASMAGCASHVFIVEQALTDIVDHQAVAVAATTQAHPSRARAPDRPPPRV